MNIYTYLKKTKQDQEDAKTLLLRKKTWLNVWFIVNFFFGLFFSALFISYFCVLSNFIYKVNHKIWTNHIFLNQMVQLNDSLLVAFIVIWVVFIVLQLWELYYTNHTVFWTNLPNIKVKIGLNTCQILSLFLPLICFYQIYLIYYFNTFFKKEN